MFFSREVQKSNLAINPRNCWLILLTYDSQIHVQIAAKNQVYLVDFVIQVLYRFATKKNGCCKTKIQKLSPEYKNTLCVICLIGSVGRHLCLKSIFYQETLPIDRVVLIKQLEDFKWNINVSSISIMKCFLHVVE